MNAIQQERCPKCFGTGQLVEMRPVHLVSRFACRGHVQTAAVTASDLSQAPFQLSRTSEKQGGDGGLGADLGLPFPIQTWNGPKR
jgi:hypothetical protein